MSASDHCSDEMKQEIMQRLKLRVINEEKLSAKAKFYDFDLDNIAKHWNKDIHCRNYLITAYCSKCQRGLCSYKHDLRIIELISRDLTLANKYIEYFFYDIKFIRTEWIYDDFYSRLLVLRGLVHSKNNRWDDAILSFRESLELQESDWSIQKYQTLAKEFWLAKKNTSDYFSIVKCFQLAQSDSRIIETRNEIQQQKDWFTYIKALSSLKNRAIWAHPCYELITDMEKKWEQKIDEQKEIIPLYEGLQYYKKRCINYHYSHKDDRFYGFLQRLYFYDTVIEWENVDKTTISRRTGLCVVYLY